MQRPKKSDQGVSATLVALSASSLCLLPGEWELEEIFTLDMEWLDE